VTAQTWPPDASAAYTAPNSLTFEKGIMYLWNTAGQIAKHNTNNFHLWIKNEGGTDVTHHALYAKLYADIMEAKVKKSASSTYVAYWDNWKDMNPSSRSTPPSKPSGVDNFKESANLGWWSKGQMQGVQPGSAQEKVLWHCEAFGLSCAQTTSQPQTTAQPSDQTTAHTSDQCQYDKPLQQLLNTLDRCPADACSAGYQIRANANSAVVCYHLVAKKCGCDSGCADNVKLKQCVQVGAAITTTAVTVASTTIEGDTTSTQHTQQQTSTTEAASSPTTVPSTAATTEAVEGSTTQPSVTDSACSFLCAHATVIATVTCLVRLAFTT